MILRITDEVASEYDGNEYRISLFDYGQKEYHPFIATNKWEKVIVDVTDETPRGYLRQLLPGATVIPVIITDKVTPRMLQVLCEVFADKAGKLRALYVKDKEGFRNQLRELMED